MNNLITLYIDQRSPSTNLYIVSGSVLSKYFFEILLHDTSWQKLLYKLTYCYNVYFRVDPGTSCYDEPKFIVFFTKLLGLFSLFCFKCKESKPKMTMTQRGTMVIVKQHCLCCGGEPYTWKSQPMMFNGRYPAGNVLLSFSVLMAGASISKILLVFKHMGLAAISARTFFFHQKNFLFPAVLHFWERYQAALIAQIRNLKDVVWSGDGRYDSMGHSAKYGVYSMFCNTILKMVHFELLQVCKKERHQWKRVVRIHVVRHVSNYRPSISVK